MGLFLFSIAWNIKKKTPTTGINLGKKCIIVTMHEMCFNDYKPFFSDLYLIIVFPSSTDIEGNMNTFPQNSCCGQSA